MPLKYSNKLLGVIGLNGGGFWSTRWSKGQLVKTRRYPSIGKDSLSQLTSDSVLINSRLFNLLCFPNAPNRKGKWFTANTAKLLPNIINTNNNVSILVSIQDYFELQLKEYQLNSPYPKGETRSICILKWDEHDSLSYDLIWRSNAELVSDNLRYINGYMYGHFENCDLPTSVKFDSITGFKYNPHKALLRIKVRTPPIKQPNISFKQRDCNSGILEFKSQDAEHYTILISSDTIKTFPRAGRNYNYSPDYFLAPKLSKEVKILYQGPDTTITVFNLVSGRKYFFAVIPGNGLTGTTLYNIDSSAYLNFKIPTSTTSKPRISPAADSSLCLYDSIFIRAITKFSPKWMDGKSTYSRFGLKETNYSYTITDSANCIICSDTVSIHQKPTPKIDSVYTLNNKPFCLGDSITLFVETKGDVIWSNGSRDYSIALDSSGMYNVSVRNAFGCMVSDSIEITFYPNPQFKFLEDSVFAIDAKAIILYSTTGIKTDWIYSNDTFKAIDDIIFNQSKILKAITFSENACWSQDSVFINYAESQLEIFPNAFSPNGDGINDIWFCLHPDSTGTLIIYDRWGGILKYGSNSWDGKKNGESLPIGTYRYTFIPSKADKKDIRRGLILLLK